MKLPKSKKMTEESLVEKKNHICKWKSFAISTFIVLEEMASGRQ